MAKFHVTFEMVNGSKEYFTIEAQSYAHVSLGITESKDGWYGIKGHLVNTSNVNSVRISEVESESESSDYDEDDEPKAFGFYG